MEIPLPEGWTSKLDVGTQKWYYINHREKITTWADPRLNNENSRCESSASTVGNPNAISAGTMGRPQSQGLSGTAGRPSVTGQYTTRAGPNNRSASPEASSDGKTAPAPSSSQKGITVASSARQSTSGQETPRVSSPTVDTNVTELPSIHSPVCSPPSATSEHRDYTTGSGAGGMSAGTPGKSLAIGPNPALSTKRLVAVGPNPHLVCGPNASLLCGSRKPG